MSNVEQTTVSSLMGLLRAPRAALLALLMGTTFGACGGDDEPKDTVHRDEGDLSVSWGTPNDEASKALGDALRQGKLFEQVAETLNDALKFPRDLPIQHKVCGEENAYYDPQTRSLSMCYELLEKIAQVSVDPNSTDEEVGNRVVGTWMFVFFHELGHGLVDMYNLPITGREEDSVDEFSTVLLVEANLADLALSAAEYWAATDSGMFSQLDFADEHSLNPQRFYDIICLVYGSDPNKYGRLVTEGYLPESRAVRCPAEYAQKRNAWDQLLAPWMK